VTLEQAYEMARRCALNHLAAIKAVLGDLDRVERVVKVTGYVNVAPGFNEMPKVINGESDLLVELWGEQGRACAYGGPAFCRRLPPARHYAGRINAPWRIARGKQGWQAGCQSVRARKG
jgi:hypothetical protein